MSKFIPRHITRDQSEQGYNNEGRGELLGYLAEPDRHETTCRYRITCDGDRDNPNRDTCTCRLGLWRETTPTQEVVQQARKTMKRAKAKVKKPTKAKGRKRP